jgi:RNA polymerase sigma-70 factor (ECF subfamily)
MAEDVMQEVFSELWAKPARYDPERGTLRAYLGMLTHRTSVDAVRSAVRRQAREERAEPVWGVAADPTDLATSQEVVRQAIDRLPSEQRRAVELTFWQGMTNHEVAQALGVPEGTVKSRLRLAEAKLRGWLQPLAMEVV